MRVKRLMLVAAVVAGMVGGLAPLGAAPASASCTTPIRMWFYYGGRIEYSLATNPVNEGIRNNWGPVQANTGLSAPQLGGTRSVAAPAVNTDSRQISCTVAPTVGVTMSNPVLPGATMTTARNNGVGCVDTTGYFRGLGVGNNFVGAGQGGNGVGVRTPSLGQQGFHASRWEYARDALGNCDTTVFDPGPSSLLTPIDPTQLGEINAWTDLSGEANRAIYKTIDR